MRAKEHDFDDSLLEEEGMEEEMFENLMED